MYISLQIIRGAAAWSVVFLHIIQGYYMGEAENIFWKAVQTFGGTGVDIFFVLSGFVMALTAPKYAGRGIRYFWLRCIRIMPVYWFYTLLLLLSFTLLPVGTYLAGWNWSSLFHSLILMIPGKNPYNHGVYPFLYVGWTLAYEMFFYIVLSLVLILKFKNPIILCAALLSVLAIALQNYTLWGQGSLILLEFVAGMVLCLMVQRTPKLITNPLTLIIGTLMMIGLYLTYGYSLQTKMSIAVMLLIYGIWAEPLCKRYERVLKFPKFLGDISYSIYLAHIVVIGWFYAFLKPDNFNDMQNLAAVAAICATVTLVSWISYRAIETGPFPNYLKKISKH